jgi:hypothetical protein
MQLNFGKFGRAALGTAKELVSPRSKRVKNDGEAWSAVTLLEETKPPLTADVAEELKGCGYHAFVDGRIVGMTPSKLAAIGRLLVKHQQGPALAWLYLQRQRDQGSVETLRLSVKPESAKHFPRDEDRLAKKDVTFTAEWLQKWKPAFPALNGIDLSGNAIDETGLAQLGDILPGIERLNLRGNIFQVAEVRKSFYEALSEAQDLKEADLSVKGLQWEKLCSALQSSTLRKLVISRKHSTGPESELWKHCHMLLNNAHIEHLDLSGQRLVEPTATLVDALKKNSCLKQFILNDCISFTKHCLDFIGAIGSHQSLQTAGLAGLDLNKDCSQLAAHLLSASCQLKELDLSLPASVYGDPFREEHPKYSRLFAFLSKNTTLRYLSIAGHPLNEKTRERFLLALATSRWQSLDIRGCGFKAGELEPSISRNSSLVRLRVDGLGECEARSAIRNKIAENRWLAPAANGIQRLSGWPLELAFHVAQYANRYGERSDSDQPTLRNMIVAGPEQPPSKSKSKLRRVPGTQERRRLETKI